MSALFERMLDVVWPRRCAADGCDNTPERPRRHLCSACLAAVPFADGPRCRGCGAPVPADEPFEFTCNRCLAEPPPFDMARGAVCHEGVVRQMVLDFKFRRRLEYLQDLVDFLEAVVRAEFDFQEVDLVVPVPLHWRRRLFERGFNQAALLAAGLAARIGRRYDGAALRRVRDTGHQSRLNAEERRENLKGAIVATRPEFVRGRTVLVVDDVFTRGETARACAAALKAAAAARVWCATVTRAAMSED